MQNGPKLMEADVEHKVKAVVQVAGLHSLVKIDPNDDDKGAWFRSVSLSQHSLFLLHGMEIPADIPSQAGSTSPRHTGSWQTTVPAVD